MDVPAPFVPSHLPTSVTSAAGDSSRVGDAAPRLRSGNGLRPTSADAVHQKPVDGDAEGASLGTSQSDDGKVDSHSTRAAAESLPPPATSRVNSGTAGLRYSGGGSSNAVPRVAGAGSPRSPIAIKDTARSLPSSGADKRCACVFCLGFCCFVDSCFSPPLPAVVTSVSRMVAETCPTHVLLSRCERLACVTFLFLLGLVPCVVTIRSRHLLICPPRFRHPQGPQRLARKPRGPPSLLAR